MSEYTSSTTILVCVSLLSLETHVSKHAIAPAVNLNIPGCRLTINNVNYCLDFLDEEFPDFRKMLEREGRYANSIQVAIEFLADGLLAPKHMPLEELSMVGLQKTLGRIIYYARNYAISQGTIQRRSFDRNREDDAYGYRSDDQYHWWDHPGNLGF